MGRLLVLLPPIPGTRVVKVRPYTACNGIRLGNDHQHVSGREPVYFANSDKRIRRWHPRRPIVERTSVIGRDLAWLVNLSISVI